MFIWTKNEVGLFLETKSDLTDLTVRISLTNYALFSKNLYELIHVLVKNI